MSSIVTAVPTGVVPYWCLMQPWFGLPAEPQQCANSSQGTYESDYETICCDGSVIDTTQDLWANLAAGTLNTIRMEDLMCCRIQGPQAGGLQPLPQVGANTVCSSGATGVPLTELAATNTNNAQDFLVTYTSAAFDGGATPTDFVPTDTPYCFWAYTKSGVELTTITLPPPQITTLSSSTSLLPVLSDMQQSASATASPSSSDTLGGSQTPSASVSLTQTTTRAGSSATSTTTQSTATSSAAASAPTLGSGHLLRLLGGLVVGCLY